MTKGRDYGYLRVCECALTEPVSARRLDDVTDRPGTGASPHSLFTPREEKKDGPHDDRNTARRPRPLARRAAPVVNAPNEDGTPSYLSVLEAACELGLSLGTVARWAESGRLPYTLIEGEKRIARADLESIAIRLDDCET